MIFISGEDTFAGAIGIVQKVGGTASIVRQEGTRSAKIGLEIYQNDTLRTGPDGSLAWYSMTIHYCHWDRRAFLVIDEFIFAPEARKVFHRYQDAKRNGCLPFGAHLEACTGVGTF